MQLAMDVVAMVQLVLITHMYGYHTSWYILYRVYHLAGEFAKHLQAQMKVDTPAGEEELWKFSEQEVLCAEIAGLCHDLGKCPYMTHSIAIRICTTVSLSLAGHGPLSHMFERYILESLVSMKVSP